MSFEALKRELSKLENGDSLLSILESSLSDKATEINNLKAQLKTAKKVLGEDESLYQEKAQKIAEYDKLQEKFNLLETQYQGSQKEVATIKRDSAITALCGKFNANKDALVTLLPEDAEITPDGIKQGDTVVPLKDYVASDAKMKIFSASIFPATTQADTKTQSSGNVSISTERGSSDNTSSDPVLESMNNFFNQQKQLRTSSISDRFKR